MAIDGRCGPRPRGVRAVRRYAAAMAVVLSLAGCGGTNPDLIPVRGTVTMTGKPVAELIVTFTPIGSTRGNGGLGATDSEGRFALTDVRGEAGVRAGAYRVSLYPTPTKSARDLPADVVSSGTARIPSILTDPNNSPLRATVAAPGTDVTITLHKDPRDAAIHTKPLAKPADAE